ncbi:MAG: GntR family transcriptional regulator [Usitatibacter sp.]
MHPLFGDSPVPRYAQLAGLMRGRIARGQWRPGERVPTLEELMREFEVARVTVRQAVEVLAREGLLSAQRGRGTFVTAAPARNRGLRLQTSLKALAEVYRHDRPQLTLLEEASAIPQLEPADGKPAARYHFMRRVHSREGEPYCVISIYLDNRVFRMAPSRFRRETVVPVLLDLARVRIARASQTLAVASADVEVAGLIGIPVNSPVAEVRRVCVDREGTVIYLGLVTYRGDYVRLEMDLIA